MLEDESLLVIERINRHMVSETILFQNAAMTVMGGQKARSAFKKLVDSYRVETRPRSSGPKAIKWPPDRPEKEE